MIIESDRNPKRRISPIMEKADSLFSHISSSNLFGFDKNDMLILYLFIFFLAKDGEKDAIDVAKGLSYEDLTELAYRARWLEKDSGIGGEEVFSFIISIRDKISNNRKEAISHGFDEPAIPLFSSLGFEIEKDEIPELSRYIWMRFLPRHVYNEELALCQAMLSVSDGDYLYISDRRNTYPFVMFAKDKDCDVLISCLDDDSAAINKMLVFMGVPESKWERYRFVYRTEEKESYRNRRKEGLEYPNKAIFFQMESLLLMDPAASGLERAIVLCNSYEMSSVRDWMIEHRRSILDLDAALSILYLGRMRSIILVDRGKERSEYVKMLSLNMREIFRNKALIEGIASAFDCDSCSEELNILRVSRDRIIENDCNLLPQPYEERKQGDHRGLTEIKGSLEKKYIELSRLCVQMSGWKNK